MESSKLPSRRIWLCALGGSSEVAVAGSSGVARLALGEAGEGCDWMDCRGGFE